MIKRLIIISALAALSIGHASTKNIPNDQLKQINSSLVSENLQTQKQMLASSKQEEIETTFEVHNPSKKYCKVKCLMLIIGDDPLVFKAAKIIEKDLNFSDQIEIVLNKSKSELSVSTLEKLYDQGYSLCLYVKSGKNKAGQSGVHVILKDPATNTVFLNKISSSSDTNIIFESHKISDALFPVLFGTPGPTLSTLAYCKLVNKNKKVICLTDFSCNLEKTIVNSNTINVIPCFDPKSPRLFYSQFTKTNCRLMQCNLTTKKHYTVCPYDGLNMQPSFSPDGSKAVLCLSSNGHSNLYLYDQILCDKIGQRAFKQITHNKGNSVSPCYLPNGNIVFCSDFKTGFPQIYHLNTRTNSFRLLTNGKGYCADPSYCPKTNKIVYTRLVKGTFQLCELDLSAKIIRERLLTRGRGDKIEPCWSECGRYIAFNYIVHTGSKTKTIPQIAIFNIMSCNIHTLTKDPTPKSFPAWTSKTLYTL